MRFSRRRLRKMSRLMRRPRKMKAPVIPPAIAPVRLLCFETVDMDEGLILEGRGEIEGVEQYAEEVVLKEGVRAKEVFSEGV